MTGNGLKKVYGNRSILTFLHIFPPGVAQRAIDEPEGKAFVQDG
jgi:hypothetical protein